MYTRKLKKKERKRETSKVNENKMEVKRITEREILQQLSVWVGIYLFGWEIIYLRGKLFVSFGKRLKMKTNSVIVIIY